MSQQQVLESLQAQVGKEVQCSDWLEITQQRVNAFAEATGDHQWIHVDPERAARESPWKATLRTATSPCRCTRCCAAWWRRPPGVPRGPAGHQLRPRQAALPERSHGRQPRPGAVRAAEVEPVTGGLQVSEQYTVEIEGQPKPACVAEAIMRLYF